MKMIDLFGYIKFDGINIIYYGTFGYVMWLIGMLFAICGCWYIISKLVYKINKLQFIKRSR